MARQFLMQTNFGAGEISPRLGARIDSERYRQGLDTLLNAVVLPEGGILRRPGFKYISTTKSSGAAVLVSFEFSTTQAYMLEFGNLYIRVYKDSAPVYSSGTTPVEIVTTYATSELSSLRFCQSLDTLYILHPSHRPATLTRTSDTAWTLADITFKGGPVREQNATEIGLEPSATSGSITLNTANIVGNGTFSDALNNWTDASAGGTSLILLNASKLRVAGIGGTGYGYYPIIVQPSTTYKITFTATRVTAPTGDITVRVCTSGGALWTGGGTLRLNEVISTSGSKSYTFTTGTGDSTDYVEFHTDVNCWDIDDLAIRPAYFTVGMAGTIFKLVQALNTETLQANATVVGATTAVMTLQTGEFIVEIAGDGNAAAVAVMDLQVSYDGGTSWTTLEQYSVPIRKRIVDTTADVKYRLYLSAYTSGVCYARLIQSVSLGSGIVLASTYVDAYSMTGTVQDAFPNTSGVIDWYDGAWSNVRGYPSLATFYENRLMFAANTEKPMTVWGSQTDDYTNFETTTDLADSEAVEYTLLSRQMNAIRWMEPSNRLRLGTATAEWWMSGATDSEPLTPSSVRTRSDTNNGTAAVQAERIGDAILFPQRLGRKLIETAYNWQAETYEAADISILAEHLFRTYGITALAYQQNPYSILWVLRSDGVLLGLTYQRSREIIAWHRHITDGTFESIAVIPGTDRDQLWAVVNRTIGGATKRYVELLSSDFNSDTDCEDAFFVDSGISSTGFNTTTSKYLKVSGASYNDSDTVTMTATGHTPFTNPGSVGTTYRLRTGTDIVDALITAYTSTSVVTATLSGDAPTALQNANTSDWAEMISSLSGLTHLEGETVSVLADGGVHANCVVASGAITLDNPAAVVHAGLPYTTDLKTLRLEGGTVDGPSQGRQKKISWICARFYQTRGAQFGRDASHLEAVRFDSLADDTVGGPLPVYSGDYPLDFAGDIDTNSQILFRQDQPLPMCILGLMAQIDGQER